MYVNKCIKCGREFETKNPKRVICPDCLYPDKKMIVSPSPEAGDNQPSAQENTASHEPLKGYSAGPEEPQRYYSAGGGNDQPRFNRPQQRPYNNQGGGYNRPQQGGYNRDNRGGYNQGGYNRDNRQGGGYNRPQQGGYNRDNRGGFNQGGYNRDNRQGGGYNRPQQGGYNRDNRGGFNNRPGGYNNRPQQGGFNRGPRPQGGFNNRRPMNRAPKQLLVSREQLEQIELLYKLMLPLPNPDCHEVIGEKIGLEPRKVFFGINLVRQKMMLPKLPFPKRKLAISPDQLFAIKNLYEPLLPLPPIGCHKIIASQLKMDEWRVHVGIGLIRSQLGLERWNQDRPDAPEEFKKQQEKPAKTKAKKAVDEEKAPAPAVDADAEVQPEKPKRGRKPKKVEEKAEE